MQRIPTLSISSLLAVFLSLPAALASDCSQWQYASLSFTTTSVLEAKEVTSVETFVLWESPGKYGIWQDGKSLNDATEKSLTEFFGVPTVHPLSILNQLGSEGWEAYSHHAIRPTASQSTRQWEFKKCKGSATATIGH